MAKGRHRAHPVIWLALANSLVSYLLLAVWESALLRTMRSTKKPQFGVALGSLIRSKTVQFRQVRRGLPHHFPTRGARQWYFPLLSYWPAARMWRIIRVASVTARFPPPFGSLSRACLVTIL